MQAYYYLRIFFLLWLTGAILKEHAMIVAVFACITRLFAPFKVSGMCKFMKMLVTINRICSFLNT